MSNERNAGRKPILSEKELKDVIKRNKEGESIAVLSKEYGVSRQALYKRLKNYNKPKEIQLDYLVKGNLCSRIFINEKAHTLRVINYADKLSDRAFGFNTTPNWHDLQAFLDNYYMENAGILSYDEYLMIDGNSDIDILKDKKNNGNISITIEGEGHLPHFRFTKKDRVLTRTDTDGYQMKAITKDRRFFVKSQAVMAGIPLRDFAVEIIAYDLCRQLSIPCVEQKRCKFVYEGKGFDGVYSNNFELDGYTFISFERLLERSGLSTKEEEFIALDAISKLKWCADKLSEIGNMDCDSTLKYMLDIALIDCLVGNIDRHTRNFGLFYNTNTGKYEIPLLFDNGMGLFENDYYRDNYHTFEEAMKNVYVAPYGEDPFDMIRLLFKEFDLSNLYPGLNKIEYKDALTTPFSTEYERRMLRYVRSQMDQ